MNTLGKGHDSGWLNINRGRRISIKIINHWHALVLALKCPSRSISNPHTSSLYKTDFSFEWAYVQHPDTNCIEVIVVSRIKSSRFRWNIPISTQYTSLMTANCQETILRGEPSKQKKLQLHRTMSRFCNLLYQVYQEYWWYSNQNESKRIES